MDQQLIELAHKIDETQKDVQEMKDFLLGNQFNKRQGLSAIIENHDNRISILEEHKALTKVYSDLFKWFFGLMTVSALGLIVYFIQHNK